MARFYFAYRRTNRDAEAQTVAPHYCLALEQHAKATTDRTIAATYLREAYSVYTFLNQKRQALVCIQRAVDLAPDDYKLHRTLATAFLDNQLYEQAAKEFQWCLRRSPGDPELQNALATAKRRLVETSNVGQRRAHADSSTRPYR